MVHRRLSSMRPPRPSDPPDFQARYKIGETLAFPVAHLALEADWPFAPDSFEALLTASLGVARQLAAALAEGQVLARAADLVEPGPAHPWIRWIEAFARARGLDTLAIHVEETGERIRLRIPTAYPFAVEGWARTALQLLRLAHRTLQGRVQVDRARWQRRAARLARPLPDAPTRALHAALSARHLFWTWQSGSRTLVGTGSRQRPVESDGDPEALADRLAADDLMVPLYAVTGSVGKTTSVRMIAQLLAGKGLRVGVTASDGAWAGERLLAVGDQIGGTSARLVLRQRDIDAAVLEYGRGGLIAMGMPHWPIGVGMLINVEDVHLGIAAIETRAQMADVKALMLGPARIALLNRDDRQCRRLGALRDAAACAWYSATASAAVLRKASRGSAGAAGVIRDGEGAPAAIAIWHEGRLARSLSLEGVAPFHGRLGEKTVDELLGAVAAIAFGPIPFDDLEAALRALRLDGRNHSFRASVHRNGAITFMLDKAAEEASLRHLHTAVDAVCASEGIGRRLCAVVRGAVETPEALYGSCHRLNQFVDEFICFDRPDAYTSSGARPDYPPGSIPHLLKAELDRVNRAAGVEKPVVTMADWDAVEAHLRARLAGATEKMLVLINQPSSSQAALNRRILDFVNRPLEGN